MTLKEVTKKVEITRKQYTRGLTTNEERYNAVIKAWDKATNDVSKAMEDNLDDFKPYLYDAKSGARGMNQLRQIAGMRGRR